MQKASDIASQAHYNAMSKSKLGDAEWDIQAIIESHFISNKSRCSYGSIVGGGSNGTILHYTSNNSLINDSDLVLIDSGCEIDGYASDITRTYGIGEIDCYKKKIIEIVTISFFIFINFYLSRSPQSSSPESVEF